MAKEIERKFLVHSDAFKQEARHTYTIIQGYLSRDIPTIRLRIRDCDAFITIKGASTDDGLSREEWEYPIPVEDARSMMKLCTGLVIEKERYLVDYGGYTWEVDVFHRELEGLVLAEIELPSEDTIFTLPLWVGKEVTGNPQYYNSVLSQSETH